MIQKKNQTINSLADLENLENSHLSIQVSLNGLVYSVYDKDVVDVVALTEYVFSERPQTQEQLVDRIKEIYDEDIILKQKFDSVNLTHKNNLVSFVPEALYEDNHLLDYLKYSVKVLENDSVTSDTILESDSKNVYIPFQSVNEFLGKFYNSLSYTHTSSILVSSLLRYYKLKVGKHFFVNVAQNTLDIVYINNNKLELFNSFLYYTKEDFLYYVLFVMEQLQLNPDEQKITLLGDISQDAALYDILYTYIRYVEFLEVENFSISEEFYQQNPHIERHQYFELLNQF